MKSLLLTIMMFTLTFTAFSSPPVEMLETQGNESVLSVYDNGYTIEVNQNIYDVVQITPEYGVIDYNTGPLYYDKYGDNSVVFNDVSDNAFKYKQVDDYAIHTNNDFIINTLDNSTMKYPIQRTIGEVHIGFSAKNQPSIYLWQYQFVK